MACILESTTVWGLIGAGIGGVCTLLGAQMQQRYSEANQRSESERQLKATVQAIRDEVEVMWDIYMKTCGSELEKCTAGQPFNYYWPVTQTYLSIFEANAHRIGDLQDGELRGALVKMYCYTKSHIDSFRMNNVLFERLVDARSLMSREPKDTHQDAVTQAWQGMIGYRAETLDVSHRLLKEAVADAKAKMDGFLTK